MHRLLLAALCCCATHAAVIRGVVLDRATSRPLARSLVTLRPVDGVGGKPQSVRADRTGQFAFTVGAGMYLLRASKDGFAAFQYGQREWKSAGKPMSVEQEGSLYLDIRLRRYAAISGTVLDENEIGIPDQKVIAYPATQPLHIAATAITDDRGIYRIHGLEPGTYYVRSAAKQLEDCLRPAADVPQGNDGGGSIDDRGCGSGSAGRRRRRSPSARQVVSRLREGPGESACAGDPKPDLGRWARADQNRECVRFRTGRAG